MTDGRDPAADGTAAAESAADIDVLWAAKQTFLIQRLGIVCPVYQSGFQHTLVAGPFAVPKGLMKAQPDYGIEPVQADEKPIKKMKQKIVSANVHDLMD